MYHVRHILLRFYHVALWFAPKLMADARIALAPERERGPKGSCRPGGGSPGG